jgi:hypothetical protein
MSVFEDEEDFAAEPVGAPARRAWQVGDGVRIVDGPRLLLGSTGTVVEVDLPGAWSVRVRIDRNGFDRATLAPHELEVAPEATP